MDIYSILGFAAGAVFVVFAVVIALSGDRYSASAWMVPAAVSLFFGAYSLFAVLAEGPFGFWAEHTRNFWGNQIWFDLLCAVGISWFLVVPPARALDMRPIPWLAFIAATSSIGFLAMIARLLYLPENTSASR